MKAITNCLSAFVLIACGGAGVVAAVGAQSSATDSRLIAYDEFRGLFAAGRYADALPYAQRVVEQTAPESVGDPDLPGALNGLAATQLRLGDFDGAEASYRRSILLLQSRGGVSPRLIEPFAGLAATFAGRNRPANAAEFYLKAIGISRSVDGLFNLAQIEMLDGLAASYQAVGNYQDAELTHLYAVQIAEKNYGLGDPRASPAILKLASWYESRRDYVAARTVYMRLAAITPNPNTDYLTMRMEALLGVGRTHRLQFTFDPQSVMKQLSSVNQVTVRPIARPFWLMEGEAGSLNRDGHEALQSAIDLLDAQDESPLGLRVRTLLELGDWFTAYRKDETALSYYTRVATTLGQALNKDEPNPLAAPRMVVYRPPMAAIRHRDLPPMQTIARLARFILTVTEKGEADDVVLSHSEMTDMQAIKVRRALEQAIYSPRFEGGRPVKTTGVVFTEYWFDLVPISRSRVKSAERGG